MQIQERETITLHDAFVVYDDADNFTEIQLFFYFDKAGIKYCTINDFPGQRLFSVAETIHNSNVIVIIVFSDQMYKNEIIKHYIHCLVMMFGLDNIITFVPSGQLCGNGFHILRRTSVIYNNTPNYMKTLLEEIQLKRLPFRFLHQLANTNDINTNLGLHGLSIRHLETNIFGLLIVAQNKCLQIDLREFHNHRDTHRSLSITDILGNIDFFQSPDTKVIIVLDNNTNDFIDVKPEVTDICSSMIKTTADMPSLNLGCHVTGRYGPAEVNLLRNLCPATWFGITQKSIESINEPLYRDYSDFETRKQSFPSEWIESDEGQVERIARAGFFSSGGRFNGRCFYCGAHITNLKFRKDPLFLHTQQYPRCKFIKENVSEEEISEAVAKFNSPDNRLVFTAELEIKYGSQEARMETFYLLANTLGIDKDNEPRFIESHFKEWATAGFYWLGLRKVIQCFRCGVRLFHLPRTRNPWVTHAMLSPMCTYVKEIKGDDFVIDLQHSQEHSFFPGKTIILMRKSSLETERDEQECLFRPW